MEGAGSILPPKFRSEKEIIAISFAKPFAFASKFYRNAYFAFFEIRCLKFASELLERFRIRTRIRNCIAVTAVRSGSKELGRYLATTSNSLNPKNVQTKVIGFRWPAGNLPGCPELCFRGFPPCRVGGKTLFSEDYSWTHNVHLSALQSYLIVH